MKKLIYLLLPVFLFLACNNSNNKAKEDENVAKTEQEEKSCDKKEGEACCKDVMCIDKFMEDRDAYVGKEVALVGKCTHVCTESGKNIFLVSPKNEENQVFGRANESLGVFDKNLEGKKVMIKGTLMAPGAEEVETHHDVEITYYVDVTEVKECECKGHGDAAACTGHKEGEACKGHKEGEGCKAHKEGEGCKGHKECPSKKA